MEGRTIVPPTYDWAEDFSCGRALVVAGNQNPELKKQPDGVMERRGYVDRAGRLAIPLKYQDASSFRDGLARTLSPDKENYEYIDVDGHVVLDLATLKADPGLRVSSATDFSGGLAVVCFRGKERSFIILGKGGKRIVMEPIQSSSSFSEGLARVRSRGRIGYADTTGHLTIPAEFSAGGEFREGLCRVYDGDTWRFIDRKGAIVAEPGRDKANAWNDAEDFHDGLARVHVGGTFVRVLDGRSYWQGGNWYYINPGGERVARYRADSAKMIDPAFGQPPGAAGP